MEIVVRATVHIVITGAAGNRVISCTARDGVIARSAVDAVITGTAVNRVVTGIGAVTADHRIVNGADAAKFVNYFKGLVENPDAWL